MTSKCWNWISVYKYKYNWNVVLTIFCFDIKEIEEYFALSDLNLETRLLGKVFLNHINFLCSKLI